MRPTSSRVLASLLVLLAVTPLAHAAFRLELIPEEYRRPVPPEYPGSLPNSSDRWQGGEAQSSYWPSQDMEKLLINQNVKKLPQGARGVRLSKIYLDFVNPILVAVYAREEKGPLDAIVFDLNGDGDLTNDPEYVGFADETFAYDFPNSAPGGESVRTKEIDYPIPNAPPCKVRVVLKWSGILVQSNLWLRGKSVLNGRELDTVIECGDGNPATRRIQLDLNREGKFKPFYTGWGNSRSSLNEFRLPLVLWQGVLYEGVFDKTRMELNWTRCPQGKLDLKFETLPKITGLSGVFADSRNAWKIFADSEREPQIPLKAGEVHLNVHLSLKTESGKTGALDYSLDRPLTIRNGETTPLTIEKPTLEITLRQSSSLLVLGRQSKISSGTMKIFSSSPVQFLIRDAQGRQLTAGEGIHAFGKGADHNYEWRLPPTLKKGDKLKVSVTWETELFGKLEAEKEITLEDLTSTPKNNTGNSPAAQDDVTMPEK